MATLRPRITFTPEAEVLAALDRIAVFRGVPKSELVNEVLGYSLGPLQELADALAELHQAEADFQTDVREIMDHVVSPQGEAAIATADFIASKRAASQPPSCNTGVTGSEVVDIARSAERA